jgi:hypothetical protein
MVAMGELAERGAATASRATGNVVNSMTTAVLAIGIGPLAVPAGALIGAGVEEGLAWVADAYRRRVQRADDMVEGAAKSAGISAEDLLMSIGSDERKQELLIRAIHAAAGAVAAVKLDTLSRAFASGAIATDPAVVDEAFIVIDALAQLDAPHLRVLTILASPGPGALPGRASPLLAATWKREDILAEAPSISTALDALIGKLQALGLVYDDGIGRMGYQEPWWALTEFGEACVRHLLERGRTETD